MRQRLSLTRRSWLAGAAASAMAAPEPLRLPRKIRIAILGFDGHTAEILSPLPQLPDVEVVAICDQDPKVLARQARNRHLKAARQYTEYRRMLDQEKLDMVAVCNNNGERAAAILECIARRLHVVAEKPLALRRDDLDQIKKAVAASSIRLTMLLPMRFTPPYLALKAVVDSGRVGEVAQIGAQKSYKAGERPAWMRHRATYGGTVPWIGIHMVDLMRWTSGREFTAAASFQSHVGFPQLEDMENVTASIFRLDNGGVGMLRMDYLRPETAPTHGDDRLRLAGTRGVAEYMAATGVTLLPSDGKPETIRELPPAQSLFIDFLQSVYHGRPAALSLADVFRVNEIVLATHEAGERGVIAKI